MESLYVENLNRTFYIVQNIKMYFPYCGTISVSSPIFFNYLTLEVLLAVSYIVYAIFI